MEDNKMTVTIDADEIEIVDETEEESSLGDALIKLALVGGGAIVGGVVTHFAEKRAAKKKREKHKGSIQEALEVLKGTRTTVPVDGEDQGQKSNDDQKQDTNKKGK